MGHARRALWAAAFTALLAVLMLKAPFRWVDTVVLTALMPALLITNLLGIRGGTDAFPMNFRYTFAFTFVIYWLLFEIGHAVRRALTRSRNQG